MSHPKKFGMTHVFTSWSCVSSTFAASAGRPLARARMSLAVTPRTRSARRDAFRTEV